MAMPSGAFEAAKVVAPHAKWLGAGQGTMGFAIMLFIISAITGQKWFEDLGSFVCCMSLISFMVAGIIAGSAVTAAGVASAGVAGVGYSNAQTRVEGIGHEIEAKHDHAMAVAQRAKALHDEGIDANTLFVQLANWMATTGMTPGMLFHKLDLDGNEVLDPYELREGFANLQIAEIPPWLMGSVIGMVDADGSEMISYDEWMAIFTKMGWKASEPHISIDNSNPVAGSTVNVTFSAPPWPSERQAWIGLMSSDVPHGDAKECDQHDVAFEYLQGMTEGTFQFTIPEGGFWDIRMFDSDTIEGSMEVASVSIVVAEKPIGDIPHFRDQEGEEVATEEVTESEAEHPLKEIISNLPEENQAKAWETAEQIEGMMNTASSDEESATAQSMLSIFVDDIVHGLPVDEWKSIGVLSTIAAGVGVAAIKQSAPPHKSEEEIDLEPESMDFEPDTTVTEMVEEIEGEVEPDDFEEIVVDEEEEITDRLSDLVDELSSTRFMSERENVLSNWNDPIALDIVVERTEKTLGIGLPSSHRGGMSILCHTSSGTAAVIRLPASNNDDVNQLRSGSSIRCSAIPAAWISGQNRVALDSESFERIHL